MAIMFPICCLWFSYAFLMSFLLFSWKSFRASLAVPNPKSFKNGPTTQNWWTWYAVPENFRQFFWHSFGICYGNFIEIIDLKAPGNYSASICYNLFSICLWEKLKTLISMISGFWDVSLSPQTNYVLFLETPGHLTKIKKITGTF